MVRVFHSLKDALAGGWAVYDRWSQGIILTQRFDAKTEIALIEYTRDPLPKFDGRDLRGVPEAADPEC